MRQARLRAFDLPAARLAAQVPEDLADVRDARRAQRVALREQPAARVHRNAPADVRVAVIDQLARLALAAEAQVLVVEQLRRREAVV